VSERAVNVERVLVVALICSGADCTEEREVVVESLDEAEGFPCECGHGFTLLRVSEAELV
jgi:hypothetical protein